MPLATPIIKFLFQDDEQEKTASIAPRSLEETAPKKKKAAPKKKMTKAATARKAGAKTRIEVANDERNKAAQSLINAKNQEIGAITEMHKVNSLLDKLGSLSPEQMTDPKTFQSVKQMYPNITQDAYFNKMVPNAINRRRIIDQLSAMPIGSKLPPAQRQALAERGIMNPEQYMSFASTLQAPSTFAGALQHTAIAQAKAGKTRSPFFAAGVALGAREEQARAAFNESLEAERAADLAEFKAKMDNISSSISNKPLTPKEKVSTALQIGKDLKQATKGASIQYEFFKNIQDFNDPEKAKSAVKLIPDLKYKGKKQAITVNNIKNAQSVRDIGLLYSLIKMLDPESVVREGEIALSDKAKGAVVQWNIELKRVLSGETLNEDLRLAILGTANDTFINSGSKVEEAIQKARNLAEVGGLREDTIFGKGLLEMESDLKLLKEEREKAGQGGTATEGVKAGTDLGGGIRLKSIRKAQ